MANQIDIFIHDKIAFNAMGVLCVYCVLANFFVWFICIALDSYYLTLDLLFKFTTEKRAEENISPR